MASSKILINRTAVSQRQPSADQLYFGQLSLNYTDGKLFYKNADGSVQVIGTNFGYITSTDADLKYLPIGGNAVSATKATQDGSGNDIIATYATKGQLTGYQPIGDYATNSALISGLAGKLDIGGKAASATTADSATSATQDASGNVITTTYATKSEVTTVQQALQSNIDTKQPAGDYATNTALSTGLAGKLDIDGKAVSAAVADSANSVAGANVTGTVASATNAVNATNDGSGNPIATTYATKSQLSGYQVAGDYATNSALTSGLAGKLDVGGKAASAVVADSANSVLGSNVSGAVASATHASSADSATTATSATTAATCTGNSATATKATQDSLGNDIVATYATKSQLTVVQLLRY